MCHLILLMPFLGLSVFWLLPFYQALTIYVMIVIFSAFSYLAIVQIMKKSVRTGREGLMHELVEVIEPINLTGYVRVHGEIWKAESSKPLKKGDYAEIIGIEGLTLKVQSHKQSRGRFSRKIK